MLGAIAGDVVGSPYEFEPFKTTEFPLFGPRSAFTDDTVLTCAVAEVLLGSGDYAAAFRRWGRRYPDVSWGGRFRQWLFDDRAGPTRPPKGNPQARAERNTSAGSTRTPSSTKSLSPSRVT